VVQPIRHSPHVANVSVPNYFEIAMIWTKLRFLECIEWSVGHYNVFINLWWAAVLLMLRTTALYGHDLAVKVIN